MPAVLPRTRVPADATATATSTGGTGAAAPGLWRQKDIRGGARAVLQQAGTERVSLPGRPVAPPAARVLAALTPPAASCFWGAHCSRRQGKFVTTPNRACLERCKTIRSIWQCAFLGGSGFQNALKHHSLWGATFSFIRRSQPGAKRC